MAITAGEIKRLHVIRPVPDVGRVAGRLAAAAQNALEVARFGGLDTGEQPSPFEVTNTERVYRLRHCLPRERPAPAGAPLILVPPLMLACEVYDVSPATGAVAQLASLGVDVWVVDFGAPSTRRVAWSAPWPIMSWP